MILMFAAIGINPASVLALVANDNNAATLITYSPTEFVVGGTYTDRSACDYETVFSFTVVSRTAKRMVLEQYGKQFTRGIYRGEDGVERCKPNGTYSMCSVISAEKHI